MNSSVSFNVLGKLSGALHWRLGFKIINIACHRTPEIDNKDKNSVVNELQLSPQPIWLLLMGNLKAKLLQVKS
jgi:hypothetical protein